MKFYNNKCPICDSKLKVDTDHMEHILMEEHHTCVNPKCKQYHYDYLTGYSDVHIGKCSEDINRFAWTYSTSEEERRSEYKRIDEKIEEFRSAYREKYGPFDNPILDCLEID